ncbi:MAG: zf-HC2 domain-containing protein [Lachnospiraceae bacterium]|nr:zf-HC2 domain-containing protein [Lachnospiraceae bacterium]
MNCNKAEKYIMKYIDGELSEKEAELLNEHILKCRICKESFYIYNRISVNMVENFEYKVPDGFEARVMKSIVLVEPIKPEPDTNEGLIGIFSVLFGAGTVLVIFRDSIMDSLIQSPYMGKIARNLMPAVEYIEIHLNYANTSLASFFESLNGMLSNADLFIFALTLLLFGVQFVLVHNSQKK